jgi:hypothetical protein
VTNEARTPDVSHNCRVPAVALKQEPMAQELGPTRPDKLTIWPVENDLFGIDVRWGGAVGNRRATVVARLLEDAGIKGRLTQGIDGSWEVRVGPVPGADVARVIDEFVW